MEKRIIALDQKKWVSKLMGYQFQIHYKSGKENRAADALSRQHNELEMRAVSLWQYEGITDLEFKILQDEHLRTLT